MAGLRSMSRVSWIFGDDLLWILGGGTHSFGVFGGVVVGEAEVILGEGGERWSSPNPPEWSWRLPSAVKLARRPWPPEVSDGWVGRRRRFPRTANGAALWVSAWLAELGAESPVVEDLARAMPTGDWPAAYAIGEHLSVELAVAA